MSVQAVHDFWQKARQDPALRQQLEELKAEGKEATIAAVVRIAAEAGFTFTTEDYDKALRALLGREHAIGELTDAELERIGGGKTCYSDAGTCVTTRT